MKLIKVLNFDECCDLIGHQVSSTELTVLLNLHMVTTRLFDLTLNSLGETSVLVGINGPMEASQRKELSDRANIEVIYRPKTGIPGFFFSNMELFK